MTEWLHILPFFKSASSFRHFVYSMEMPQGGDWRADMECYDKVLSAYEERLNKAMQSAQQQQAEDTEQLEEA